jgi:hypothetical protein
MRQVEELRERLQRALADMENLRERTARAQEQSRQFAIQAWPPACSPHLCSLMIPLKSVACNARAVHRFASPPRRATPHAACPS